MGEKRVAVVTDERAIFPDRGRNNLVRAGCEVEETFNFCVFLVLNVIEIYVKNKLKNQLPSCTFAEK